MDIYKYYRSHNKAIARGKRVYFTQEASGCSFSTKGNSHEKPLRYPKIGIYTGKGASHSWLWFVELFDRMGFYDCVFLTETEIQQGGLNNLNVLVMSGGDTFAVAEGLGAQGADKLGKFIKSGGLYIGSCAGAYLPLRSSKTHLNLFNFVNVKISNLTKVLPEARKIPEKFCTPYGCSFIFHPIREEVMLFTNGISPFKGVGSIIAPLYGGPSMLPSQEVYVLARYQGFTDKTMFLVDEEIATETIISKAAVVKSKMGSGCLYLFGPHFEHPYFPVANKLLADVIYWDMSDIVEKENKLNPEIVTFRGRKADNLLQDIKRELSNSRIVALGMEMMPINWLIGRKIYEPTKIRVFLDVMWDKLKILERWKELRISLGEYEEILKYALHITDLLRKIKNNLRESCETIDLARDVFGDLKIISRMFLNAYFRTANNIFGG